MEQIHIRYLSIYNNIKWEGWKNDLLNNELILNASISKIKGSQDICKRNALDDVCLIYTYHKEM